MNRKSSFIFGFRVSYKRFPFSDCPWNSSCNSIAHPLHNNTKNQRETTTLKKLVKLSVRADSPVWREGKMFVPVSVIFPIFPLCVLQCAQLGLERTGNDGMFYVGHCYIAHIQNYNC